jgi:hypothetical protein
MMLLLCLVLAPLAGNGIARPFAVELPVWFGTTLLVKSGPAANCPTLFACAVMSAIQRPGVSIWLITRSPDHRKTGWHNLFFVPSD